MVSVWESENTPGLFSEIWTLFNRGAMVPRCAWCGRVRIAETWAFPPVGALEAIDARLAISHSICPTCVETVAYPTRSLAGSGRLDQS